MKVKNPSGDTKLRGHHDSKLTPKQMAKKAFEDLMNRGWDLPFGYGDKGDDSTGFHSSTERVQRLAEAQFVKMLNRALKAVGSQDYYEPGA